MTMKVESVVVAAAAAAGEATTKMTSAQRRTRRRHRSTSSSCSGRQFEALQQEPRPSPGPHQATKTSTTCSSAANLWPLLSPSPRKTMSSLQANCCLTPTCIYTVSLILWFMCCSHLCDAGSTSYHQGDDPAVYASFGPSNATINFTHITVDQSTGRVYVGATNWLYQFNDDLSLEYSVRTGPVDDSPNCSPTDCSGVDRGLIRATKNVNKVLVVDPEARMLVVCGSVRQGTCRRHRLDDVREAEGTIGEPVAANDENSSTIAFVGPANYFGTSSQSVLYVAATHSRLGPYRDMVPAISSRSLEPGPRLFGIIEESFSNTARLDISFHLKDYFLVKYIYGFAANGYVYFATVQKKTHFRALEEWGYVTRLARICDSDAGYHTYTEVTIQCSKDGIDYSILQDATVIKAGSRLADELRINRGSDVLIGAFATAGDHTNRAGPSSALCVYPLADIEQKFAENIHMCYNGSVLTRDMDYIAGSVNDCPDAGAGNIVNFCNEAVKLNGSVPLYSRPLVVYPNRTLTAVAASTSAQHTVAFLGTADGLLKKVLLVSATQAFEFEEVLVDRGRPILADLYLDSRQDFIYAASPYRVAKIKVKRCEGTYNCTECLSARNPYCGWCTAEGRCLPADECPDDSPVTSKLGSLPKWMDYEKLGFCSRAPIVKKTERPTFARSDKAPGRPDAARITFDEVRPAGLPISSSQSIVELVVQNLPELPRSASYLCYFGERTNPVRAHISKRGLSCQTPPFGERPSVSPGWDHVKLNLAIKSSVTDSVLAEHPFVFFDCGVHQSCEACASSAWSCNWCVHEGSCRANSSTCAKELRPSELRGHPVFIRTPESCPTRVDPSTEVRPINAVPRFGEIRPSALSISAHAATIELMVQHLPQIDYGNPYLCFFGDKASPVRAKTSRRGLSCSAPPFSERPAIGRDGSDHVAVNLTVRNSLSDANLVQRPFVFYDCGVHRSCGACVTSSWDCNWCVLENSCTSNASSCSAREAIVGVRSLEPALVRGVDNCPNSKSGAEEILVTDTNSPEVQIDGIYRNWMIGLISAAGALFLILSIIMLVMSRLNARGFLRSHHGPGGARLPLGTHLRRQHGWLHEPSSPAEVPVQSWNYFGRGDPQFERTTLKPIHGNQRPVLSLTEDVGRYTLVRLQPPLVDVRLNENESRLDHWKTMDADSGGHRIKY